MKLKRRKIKRGRVEIIPMIDTVVILLIFYMTFSRFAQMSQSASIKLPDSVSGDESRKDSNQVVVNMVSTDKVLIGENEYPLSELPRVMWGYFSTSLPRLDPAMASKIKSGEKKPAIILRANKDMTYRDLNTFMKTCTKINLTGLVPDKAPKAIADVTFATLEK
jgi:biopolymer transport protein ExbD